MLVEPVYSRVTGVWTTVIARKITGPKGEFLGAIGRGIEPVNFEKFFATVALGPGATFAMHHTDGTLLARYPHVADMVGKNFKTGPVAQRQIFESPHSTSRLTSPIDGADRLISSRALTNFPLVIIASTTTSAALADWREQIGILITIDGLSVLAIIVLTGCTAGNAIIPVAPAPTASASPTESAEANTCPVSEPVWAKPPDDAAVQNPAQIFVAAHGPFLFQNCFNWPNVRSGSSPVRAAELSGGALRSGCF
jgi:hypothetical protein